MKSIDFEETIGDADIKLSASSQLNGTISMSDSSHSFVALSPVVLNGFRDLQDELTQFIQTVNRLKDGTIAFTFPLDGGTITFESVTDTNCSIELSKDSVNAIGNNLNIKDISDFNISLKHFILNMSKLPTRALVLNQLVSSALTLSQSINTILNSQSIASVPITFSHNVHFNRVLNITIAQSISLLQFANEQIALVRSNVLLSQNLSQRLVKNRSLSSLLSIIENTSIVSPTSGVFSFLIPMLKNNNTQINTNPDGDNYPTPYNGSASIPQTLSIVNGSVSNDTGGKCLQLSSVNQIEVGNAAYINWNPYNYNNSDPSRTSPRGWLKEYVVNRSNWQFKRINRLSFWLFMPTNGADWRTDGRLQGTQIGVYNRQYTNPDLFQDESSGMHFYYNVNPPATGTWQYVVLNNCPDHIRGAVGNVESVGILTYLTAPSGGFGGTDPEATYNYFDTMTRFYIEYGAQISFPYQPILDRFVLYEELNNEDVQGIRDMIVTYRASDNRFFLTWCTQKDDQNTLHDVRYSFNDIHQIGWNNATPAPVGSNLVRQGDLGYNSLTYTTTTINVTGHSAIYFAMKRQSRSDFGQIKCILNPVASGGVISIGGPTPVVSLTLEDFTSDRLMHDGTQKLWRPYTGGGQVYSGSTGVDTVNKLYHMQMTATGSGNEAATLQFCTRGDSEAYINPYGYSKFYVKDAGFNNKYNRLRFKMRCDKTVTPIVGLQFEIGNYLKSYNPDPGSGFQGEHQYWLSGFGPVAGEWATFYLTPQCQHQVEAGSISGITFLSKVNWAYDSPWNTPGNQYWLSPTHFMDCLTRWYIATENDPQWIGTNFDIKDVFLDTVDENYEPISPIQGGSDPNVVVMNLVGTIVSTYVPSLGKYRITFSGPKNIVQDYQIAWSTSSMKASGAWTSGTWDGQTVSVDNSDYTGVIWLSPPLSRGTYYIGIKPVQNNPRNLFVEITT